MVRTLAIALLLPGWAAGAWLPGRGRAVPLPRAAATAPVAAAAEEASTREAPAAAAAVRPSGVMLLSTQQARARARAEAREHRESQDLFLLPRKIGVDEVISPTAIPPPPPEINGWYDHQPIDTQMGILFVNRFAEQPTVTPPPSQSSLDVSFACPLLSEWPETMMLDSLGVCGGDASGNWTVQGDSEQEAAWILGWRMTCGLLEGGTAPVVKYAMPTGDLFGTSTILTALVGNTMVLRDCAGNTKYYIDEKVFHEDGETDPHACEAYGSCDGTIWLQYIIYNENHDELGRTSYLHLFQDSVTFVDTRGSKIAIATRVGEWKPHDGHCGSRKWKVTFTGTAETFASPYDQWAISELVTMMAIRDEYRSSRGLTRPTACEVFKFGVRLVLFLFLLGVSLCGCMIFFKTWIGPVRTCLVNLEHSLCPKGMKKPGLKH